MPALRSKGCEVRKKKKKKKQKKKKAVEMQPAREEDDGGGATLKDCFAKDLSFVIVLLVYFFQTKFVICLKVFLIIWIYELFCWFV